MIGTIRLPWPNKALQSNSRTHWAAKSEATKNARWWAMVAARGANLEPCPNATILVEYYPPSYRGDVHNVPSSLKAYIDGIADAMGCDDKGFRVDYPTQWAGRKKGGEVVFRIVPAADVRSGGLFVKTGDRTMADGDEWKGTKAQRDKLRQTFGGRCGYCGDFMARMQADHIKPITRLTTDPWGRLLPASERRMINPDRNVVGNMMPACAPCNNSKGGYRLEEWREMIARSHEIVAREKSIFRAGVRFGVIRVTENPVVFHFERNKEKPE